MLTIAKLTTYAELNGDIDGWARAADSDDATGLTDAAWYLTAPAEALFTRAGRPPGTATG